MQLHELQKTLRDMQKASVEKDEMLRSTQHKLEKAEQQVAHEREEAEAARAAAAKHRQQQKVQSEDEDGEEERVRALSASAVDLATGDAVRRTPACACTMERLVPGATNHITNQSGEREA